MPFVFLFALFTLYQCFSGIRKGIIYLNTKKKPNQEDKRLIIGGIAGVLGGITGWILFYNLLDNNSYNPALDQWRPYMMAYFILFAFYTSYLGITYKMKDADKAAAFNKKGLVVIIKIALF